jgi:ABC-type sugar transport system ATPase subunit
MSGETTPVEALAPRAEPGAEALRVEGISKRFGPVTALRDITLHVRAGEVLGLLGDNGAGKSTLIKIITGFHRPDSGAVRIGGREVSLRSVAHARSLGIETVYQDLALIDELPVYLNFFLNKELTLGPFLRHGAMRHRAAAALAEVGIDIPSVAADVRALSGGQRQAIAVARAVDTAARVLLLDEPLAAMGAREGGRILRLIDRLRERGDLAVILIAHNYSQVMDVCDRVNLLQHGRITFDRRTAETSVAELLELVHAEYRTA